MTDFVTHVERGNYHIEYDTKDFESYLYVQDACRKTIDRNERKLYTSDEVMFAMVEAGQGDTKKFKLGETIRFSPSEVKKILDGEYER